MTALQVSIGTVNDIVDAPRDRDGEAGQADPRRRRVAARRLSRWRSRVGDWAWRSAWAAGPLVLLLAIVVLAIGYGYDLVFKGTAWSWLPFAIGIPLLPVYGWVGATGGVPAVVRGPHPGRGRRRGGPRGRQRAGRRGPGPGGQGRVGRDPAGCARGRGGSRPILLAVVVVAAVADPGRG